MTRQQRIEQGCEYHGALCGGKCRMESGQSTTSDRYCHGRGMASTIPINNDPDRHNCIPVKVLWRKRWVCVRCGRIFKKEPCYGW